MTDADADVDEVPCPGCGGGPCWHAEGWVWCRPCEDHHRPPECDIDEDGFPLFSCGCRWDDLAPGGVGHRPGCPADERNFG